jgi:hypothetical protein
MKCNRSVSIGVLLFGGLLIPFLSATEQTADQPSATSDQPKHDHDKVVDSGIANPVLWRDPGEIAKLDLYYGQGSKDGQPLAPFKFDAEDKSGSNPKFDVSDAHGTKWRVKLGDEARPEVVASRLLWAMGYFVDDDYLVASADVDGLAIERRAKAAKDEHITDARFERKPEGEDKVGIWRWKKNPFTGKREFNGLRVLMAVMNNWDLKDVNNAVYSDQKANRAIFLTSDIGATFGTNGLSWTKSRSKGNVESFEGSKFITRKTETEVDFATPKAPTAVLIESAGTAAISFEERRAMEWIGRNIPIADARWMGSQLKQLSHQQLVDAFRAGHFPEDQIEAYVKVVEGRIDELAAL